MSVAPDKPKNTRSCHRPNGGPDAGPSARPGFSIIELLVVIGLIAVLLGLLLPAIKRAQDHAKWVNCQSNLRQVGVHLLIYINQSKGWVYPVGPTNPLTGLPTVLGFNMPRDQRWPVYVFDPPVWNPPILKCPGDDPEPMEDHSYVLNEHLADKHVTYSSANLGGIPVTEVVVIGEKVTSTPDYYMERNEFDRVVEPYRHGLSFGSNYLYLDMHVTTDPPGTAKYGMDPWDPPSATAQPAGPPQ